MRFVPGLIFALMAIAVYGYNDTWPQHAINLPFLDVFLERGTRAARGQLTWQLIAGLSVVLLGFGVLTAVAKPRPERFRPYT